MRPIEKTANDLFQKLRSRFSPVTLGNEQGESTTSPNEARFFNMIYKENDEPVGPVSISLVDGRGMKVFFGENIVDAVQDKASWYGFLKELREFAKRNLLTFDARDMAKDQLDSRDFDWLSKADGTMKEKDVSISESTMWGSKRRSYQALESVKIIVQHSKSVDEAVPGARSRSIHGIYLERSDGERYKFPFNYLTGARAMARHVSEGGTPYDDMGQHILGMIGEMRDLSKFARMTRSHAMEDEHAAEIRNKIVERYQGLKATLGAMSHPNGYKTYAENYKPSDADPNGKLDEIKEIFTRKIWDQKMEQLLPAVGRALASAEVTEASSSVEKMIRDPKKLIVLKADPAADQMIRKTKFTDAMGLMGFILSDIASRAIGDDMDALANFASDVAERLHDRELDPKDKQLGMLLAKRYMDDIKKMATDPAYGEMVRKDPREVYGAKKKREGGFHEAQAYEAWANDVVGEDSASLKSAIEAYADAAESEDWDEAEQILSQIEQTYGKKAASDAEDHAHASRFGRGNIFQKIYQKDDPLSNILRRTKQGSELRTTKSGMINKQDQKYNAAAIKSRLGKHPSPVLPEGEHDWAMDWIESPVAQAIFRRISMRHVDLLQKHGLDKVLQAVQDEAEFVGDVDEIGSSDVSAWVNNIMRSLGVNEATPVAPQQPASPGAALRDPKLQQAAKNVSKVTQAAGIKAPPNQIAQAMAAQAAGKAPGTQTKGMLGGIGSTIMQAAASDPKKAAALTSMMKKMVVQGKFDEAAVRELLMNDSEVVVEKELKVKDDQDGDGDSDFADVMVARRMKSGEPKAKAIAATKDKPYNEADINEDKLMAESLQLIKVLAGL